MGGYVFDAKAVEIIEVTADGTWGRVNIDTTTGWVNMTNMLLVEDDMPLTLACFGSDPFWNLDLSNSKASTWATPDTNGPITFATTGIEKREYEGAMTLNETSARPGLEVDFTAKITPAACTYLGRDNAFGLKIDVLLKGYSGFASPEGDEIVSGCCSLQP